MKVTKQAHLIAKACFVVKGKIRRIVTGTSYDFNQIYLVESGVKTEYHPEEVLTYYE